MLRRVVVLPQPEGPRRAKHSPWAISQENPRTPPPSGRLYLAPWHLSRKVVLARFDALNRHLGSALRPELGSLRDIREKTVRWPQMAIPVDEADALLAHYYGSKP